MRKPLFSLLLLPLITISSGINSQISATPLSKNQLNSRQIIAQKTLIGSIVSFWERRPRRRLGSRSSVCAISPGLVETYLVWSDRPLFLWDSPRKNEKAQIIIRDDATEKEVWKQTVNLTDQKVFYNGEQSLEPGKRYQWQLLGQDNLNITSPSTFQVMTASDRNQIQSELQTLEQKLTKATPEEIALQKANYFLDYKIPHKTEDEIFHLWSDALETLYQVEQPSPSFIQKRQAKVESLCKQTS